MENLKSASEKYDPLASFRRNCPGGLSYQKLTVIIDPKWGAYWSI
jgi:hypothetical protein